MLRKVDPSSVFRIPSSVRRAPRVCHHSSVLPRTIFLCLLSAILLASSFSGKNLWLLAWLGFVPLFFALKGQSWKRAFFLGYLTGILFWIGTIYWLIHVTLLGQILLILYLSLYFGVFGLLFRYITHYTSHITQTLLLSLGWVLLEYARSYLLTGFPWALLGYSQYLNLPVIQIADFAGPWGVSFLVMMGNLAIYSHISYLVSADKASDHEVVANERSERSNPILRLWFDFAHHHPELVEGLRTLRVLAMTLSVRLPLICLVIALIYGYYKIYWFSGHSSGERIRVSLIQANIPQQLKWDEGSREMIIDKFLGLTKEAARDKPDLIIWPEAALPFLLDEQPQYYQKVAGLVKESGVPLLFGAVRRTGENFYNSAVLISEDGVIDDIYDKLHLVPFGEYIPLRKSLPFLETIVPIGDFSPGKEYRIFRVRGRGTTEYGIRNTHDGLKIAVLICFEDTFPELAKRFVKAGAEVLVNITNDAWFGDTASPYQHLQASVFRAVENRVPLVRCANTGISAFISPTGKIYSYVQDEYARKTFIEGYKTEEVTIPPSK